MCESRVDHIKVHVPALCECSGGIRCYLLVAPILRWRMGQDGSPRYPPSPAMAWRRTRPCTPSCMCRPNSMRRPALVSWSAIGRDHIKPCPRYNSPSQHNVSLRKKKDSILSAGIFFPFPIINSTKLDSNLTFSSCSLQMIMMRWQVIGHMMMTVIYKKCRFCLVLIQPDHV